EGAWAPPVSRQPRTWTRPFRPPSPAGSSPTGSPCPPACRPTCSSATGTAAQPQAPPGHTPSPGTDRDPVGWTWAGNTPFRRWKRETRRGGTSDPFRVHCPQGFKAGGQTRTQSAHTTASVPTSLAALSLQPPAAIRGVTQSPIHGVSFAHTLDDPAAATRHRTQYYEMLAHRAIDHDG